MNILLTGATGFLGSHILNTLVHKKEYKIIVLKRSFSNIKLIKKLINRKHSNIRLYDIDKYDIEQVFKENIIDTILHCATLYGRNNNKTVDVIKTNILFPIELINFAIKYNVKNFINTDSYFNKKTRNFFPHNLVDYSISKQSFLFWLKYYSKYIKVINIILEHPFGNNDNKFKFVSYIIDKIVKQKVDFIALTDGNQKRDFIYIDDVVNAYITVLKCINKIPKCFNNFELGTGKVVSLKNFVEEIKKISNSKTKLGFGSLPYRENEIMYSKANNSHFLKLGWKPKYTYKSGLKEMLKGKK